MEEVDSRVIVVNGIGDCLKQKVGLKEGKDYGLEDGHDHGPHDLSR